MRKEATAMKKPSTSPRRSASLPLRRRPASKTRVANYEGFDFGQAELTAVMRRTYDDIIAFVTTPEFKALHAEMMSLAPKDRPTFVAKVLLDSDELTRRNIAVPEGILIQTSAFGDRRPTLFVVKKLLPNKYSGPWENLNLTFDNEYADEDVSRSPEKAWRPPLPVALQNALIASNADLESVPVERGVDFVRILASRQT
jgi:hypothetical protein